MVSSAAIRYLRGDTGGAAAAATALMARHPSDRRVLHTVVSLAALVGDPGLAQQASRTLQASLACVYNSLPRGRREYVWQRHRSANASFVSFARFPFVSLASAFCSTHGIVTRLGFGRFILTPGGYCNALVLLPSRSSLALALKPCPSHHVPCLLEFIEAARCRCTVYVSGSILLCLAGGYSSVCRTGAPRFSCPSTPIPLPGLPYSFISASTAILQSNPASQLYPRFLWVWIRSFPLLPVAPITRRHRPCLSVPGPATRTGGCLDNTQQRKTFGRSISPCGRQEHRMPRAGNLS